MKDPSRSSTSPSIINEDVIINGHSHEDDNPFAEYMWMENEEEFNRQVKPYLVLGMLRQDGIRGGVGSDPYI
uniref:Poly(A) binding protein interacting protein 2 n=1 Tax=Terrapene triunguis TaxID=2587831 RepID=A0A674J8J7_9SAUR